MALKILFSFFPLFVKYNHGIALLSALCKEKGIETDLYVLDEPDKFRKYLRNSDANCVGFSCVTEHDYLKSLPFMEVAHEEKATMLGGIYPQRVHDIEAPVDLVCRGEGETLPDFLLNGDNTLFENNMVYPDLNKLPLPDYELFENIPFKRSQLPVMKDKKILPYYSSRGCPYHCSFCEVQYQPKGIRVRYNVENDISYLVDRYQPDIVFMGDTLLPYYDYNWRESWGNDITLPFVAYIRADIPKDTLSWLIEHGMIACAFGIESGNESYRNDVLNKQLFDTDIFRTVEILNKNNVEFAPFYMTDTPGETFTLKAQTYKMADKIGGYPVFFKYEELGVGD